MYIKADQPSSVAPTAAPFVNMTITDILRVLAVGLLVGLVTMGLYYALNYYIFSAALCRSGVEGCSSAPTYSAVIATVVGIIVGIIALAKAGVYRPLPLAIAAVIALWGMFGPLSNNVVWYWGLLVGAVFYGLAYILFAWLSRIRSFLLSVLVLAVVAIFIRVIVG